MFSKVPSVFMYVYNCSRSFLETTIRNYGIVFYMLLPFWKKSAGRLAEIWRWQGWNVWTGLHSKITPEIMCRHFLHPHLTPGKPIFHPRNIFFKIQTGSHLTPAEKTWFTKLRSRKFQADIQSEYHRRNPWASNPFTFLSPHFKISQFFSYSLLIANFHSTETALLKPTNDVMETIDSGKITILTALDMSAAFDSLDHITLLHKLQHTSFGLSGYVISWIRSYLTDRSSFVKIDSSSSPSTIILTGMPQGSVLGPLLFVLFISPVTSKNLGVYLDSKMSFDKQVPETCRAWYFHIRALRHICASLTTEASKTIAAAIVDSWLDFCNSLLAGTSVSNLTRLQRVQNTIALVVAQKPRFCDITPVLSDLHWLPVRQRISFKIATVTFRVL